VKGQPARFICGHWHRQEGAARARASVEYLAFRQARNRCTNPNYRQWQDYGGRGIKFLFTSFEQFLAHIGPRPAGVDAKGRTLYSLDRKDNDGNYELGNVRWSTREEQNGNRRIRKDSWLLRAA
jgi:hypothetical protein